ncbi:MAG: class I SAM-dependent methyltransferase [Candidatus Omnitrophica bacterium]|nr:class I SAM-dependent methyltransferase [Candidatus Omnitrophota bacterium]
MHLKRVFKKIQNRIFHRVLGKMFFQGEDFYTKPSLKKFFIRNINQFVNEKGWQTPFIYTNEECLDFWKSIDNKSPSIGNRPENYAKKENTIVEFLHNFWTPEIEKANSILEIGCNCGANLFILNRLGYINLTGVEINPMAIKEMEKSFPRLKENINILIGDIGEILRKMKDGEADIIFTMGVCMHIHPTKNYIFEEIARVAKKYICTIEPETANSNYVFARNYRRVFEKLGCRQLKSVLVGRISSEGIRGNNDCIARLFKL